MKVRSVNLKNFKKFKSESLDFGDSETGKAKDLIVLLGNNGSGKSTVLQAIACTLGAATGRISSPGDLKWPGFDFELASSGNGLPTKITLHVEFNRDEVLNARSLGELSTHDLPESANSGYCSPVDMIKGKVDPANGRIGRFLFQRSSLDNEFGAPDTNTEGSKELGNVFWYPETREILSPTPVSENGKNIQLDDSRLRTMLWNLMYAHKDMESGEYEKKPDDRDYFEEIQVAFTRIFPTKKLIGRRHSKNLQELIKRERFYLADGDDEYELSEMSGGERAVFPLIFDFVRWNINNSVILIDEIELHLHPPAQQVLISGLRKLGKNNQFIITTHSDSIEQIVPESSIIRLGD